MCSTILDAGLIKKGELFKVIANLPDDHPRKAEFMMEQAGILGWRDKRKLAEAEELYEKARALALSDGNEKLAHLCDALHARLLGQKNRKSEAWTYAQRVDPELLAETERKWFTEGVETWKKEAAKAKKPKPEKKPTPEKETEPEPATQAVE